MKKYKKWGIAFAVIAIIGFSGFFFRKQIAVLAFDMFLSGHVEETLDKSYKPIEGKEEVIRKVTEPFSVLLLGVDQRDKEIGRSDTIIYSVVRPQDNKVLLLSIPRDAYTEIIGKGFKTKLNHAYAYGGAKMSMESVDNLLNHKVDHYATINFNGLKDVVDALDGVKLPITKDIVNKDPNHEKFRIEANKPIYNGQEALYFVRYREDSDMNRTMRHRIFLNSVMERAIEMDKIARIPELIEIMGDNFTTDMRPKYMIDLAKTMFTQDDPPQISSYMLHGDGKMMDNVWYYMVDDEDLEYVQKLLNNWLDASTPKAELMAPRPMRED
ncbi:LCP family protein [Paenibacillus sp. MER TA 81-3]|uniref:LCP family protein n=1 Tax=Paenibacillus sp. MER TA 81-3 TaxID=2939573 RepID=UPI00203D68A1|nr:LCP family protein [Paenibacillus sp. MER TA 81-3]MCM3340990.1 LCP family protein [Paenibacillus sp. MER TA 81-3]